MAVPASGLRVCTTSRALTMVSELFATAGAGQEAEIFAFASDVDADQRIEIRRMGTMLEDLPR